MVDVDCTPSICITTALVAVSPGGSRHSMYVWL